VFIIIQEINLAVHATKNRIDHTLKRTSTIKVDNAAKKNQTTTSSGQVPITESETIKDHRSTMQHCEASKGRSTPTKGVPVAVIFIDQAIDEH
jgi:hypothetical protein